MHFTLTVQHHDFNLMYFMDLVIFILELTLSVTRLTMAGDEWKEKEAETGRNFKIQEFGFIFGSKKK